MATIEKHIKAKKNRQAGAPEETVPIQKAVAETHISMELPQVIIDLRQDVVKKQRELKKLRKVWWERGYAKLLKKHVVAGDKQQKASVSNNRYSAVFKLEAEERKAAQNPEDIPGVFQSYRGLTMLAMTVRGWVRNHDPSAAAKRSLGAAEFQQKERLQKPGKLELGAGLELEAPQDRKMVSRLQELSLPGDAFPPPRSTTAIFNPTRSRAAMPVLAHRRAAMPGARGTFRAVAHALELPHGFGG